ncbi:MAG: right-handed parallel beta-helix repeat-containing protein [Proteobacteria bacterium]|nr:right-handed parallel beta-helix repeat-containing protein [Pseudomonadota bacterium]MBU1739041.1 right-handed parallel beta-helix repeat-containing protein [Pseudomonadota bacterium]
MKNSLRVFSVVSTLLLLLSSGGCSRQESVEIRMGTLEKDTTWSGQVTVTGDVYVPPGVTLTVLPGTIVRFKRIEENMDNNLYGLDSPYYPVAEIIIRGKLLAVGTPDKNIVFTSAELEPQPADWGAINFLGSEGNVVKYTKLFHAYNGIHAHGSSVEISDCEFVKNGVGVSFKVEEETQGVPWFGKRSTVSITRSLFAKNKGGIGLRSSDAEITHNEIIDNKFFGVWPKENCKGVISYNEITGNKKGVYLYQAQGINIEFNNIYDNKDYNIAVAEAQDFPVEARNNWFGSKNRQKIDELIFDKQDDADLGEIFIDPVLDKPVDWKAGK